MTDKEFNKKYFPKKTTQLWSLSWQIELLQRDIQKEKEMLEHLEKKLSDAQEQYSNLAKEIDNG